VKQPDYTPTEQVNLCGNAHKIHKSSNTIPPETDLGLSISKNTKISKRYN
jgi:hypothetical protein